LFIERTAVVWNQSILVREKKSFRAFYAIAQMQLYGNRPFYIQPMIFQYLTRSLCNIFLYSSSLQSNKSTIFHNLHMICTFIKNLENLQLFTPVIFDHHYINLCQKGKCFNLIISSAMANCPFWKITYFNLCDKL